MMDRWTNWVGFALPSYRVFRFSLLGDHWVEGYTLLDGQWQLTACGNARPCSDDRIVHARVGQSHKRTSRP